MKHQSPEPSVPETPRIEVPVQVMFFDTDCAAVVHNIAYLRFIEIARTLLAEQLGMGLVDMARTQIYPVVVRTEIDYKKPAVLGDQLIIHGRLETVDRLRFWCAFEIRRPAYGALLVTSRQMLAVIQMPPGKPMRLPADWAVRCGGRTRERRRQSHTDPAVAPSTVLAPPRRRPPRPAPRARPPAPLRTPPSPRSRESPT